MLYTYNDGKEINLIDGSDIKLFEYMENNGREIALQLREYCAMFSQCTDGCRFVNCEGYCMINDSPYKWRHR